MRSRCLLTSLAFCLVPLGGSSRGAPPEPAPPHLVHQAGAEDSVMSVTFSPDGSLLATGDGRIRIHEARTGALLRAIGSDVERGGRKIVFSPDGRSVAPAGFHMDKLIRLYDPRTGALQRTLAGHTEIETYTIAFSPDGRWLGSAGTDKQILVWDLSTGTLRHRFEGQPFPVTALAFSPDGATLASGGGEKTIRLWDSTSGRLLRSLAGHTQWVCALAFSPDGKTIASGSCDWAYHRGRDTSRFDGTDPGCESELKLWDAATGDLRRATIEPGRLLSLAIAPDGGSLACGVGKDVRLYDLRTETPGRVVTSHDGAITSVAFSPDGRAIVSGSHDRTAKCVALPTGTVDWHLPGYWEQVNSVALSGDGSLIATGSSDLRYAARVLGPASRKLGPGAVRLWDAKTGKLLRRMGDPAEQVMAVAVSPDRQRVASACGRPGNSGVVRLWDTGTGAQAWSAEDHSSEVLAVAFTPDGSSLASAGADGRLELRDPATGSVTRTLAGHGGGATSVMFSADGAAIACGAGDSTTYLWDVRTGRLIRTFRPSWSLFGGARNGGRPITSVALTPDGRTLATGCAGGSASFGDRIVRVWDTQTGKLERQITTSQTSGRLVVLSPDGTTLATSGVGKAINLCDIRTGNVLRTLQGHAHPPQSVAFSADGRFLVSGGDYRTTKVWEVASGRLLATLVTFSESQRGVADDWLAHTPEGYHDGSPGIDQYLAWWVDDELQTPASLGLRLHRPDRLAATLQLSLSKSD